MSFTTTTGENWPDWAAEGAARAVRPARARGIRVVMRIVCRPSALFSSSRGARLSGSAASPVASPVDPRADPVQDDRQVDVGVGLHTSRGREATREGKIDRGAVRPPGDAEGGARGPCGLEVVAPG